MPTGTGQWERGSGGADVIKRAGLSRWRRITRPWPDRWSRNTASTLSTAHRNARPRCGALGRERVLSQRLNRFTYGSIGSAEQPERVGRGGAHFGEIVVGRRQ